MSKTGGEQTSSGDKRPVIFGEVLFDTFPDGTAVLGGAPFNVAWHLQGFGARPLFISRIGNDDRGAEVQQALVDWGMDSTALQIDPHHPTGLVRIQLNKGQPSFSILSEQAYDFIDPHHATSAIAAINPSVLYYGSLICRSDISATTLKQLRASDLPGFVDINLRAPFYTRAGLNEALSGARWLKLNDDEVGEFARLGIVSSSDLITAARQLIDLYQLELIIVTQGADGAFVATVSEIIDCPAVRVANLVDTVGAGDAFSSVMLLGLIQGWDLKYSLSRALEFAAAICGRRGATSLDRQLYQDFLKRWLTT